MIRTGIHRLYGIYQRDIITANVEGCKLLLNEGADPHQELPDPQIGYAISHSALVSEPGLTSA